jgi:phosphoribosyl 1,2-cyclic phosphodiesterase
MSNSYVRFWGVRGSYSAPFQTHLGVGGNTSCVEIRVDDHVLLCDAGTGIVPFGNEMMRQRDIRRLLILLTHYHWDHICGLPFFVPAFMRDWDISIFGPGQSSMDIEEYVSAQMRAPYFPVGTETWLANINYLAPTRDSSLQYGPIGISYQSVHHPGTTYGYRIKACGKTILYISDNECLFLEKSINRQYDNMNPEEQELYDKMKKEEYEWELDLIKGADLLIHDAQYTPQDYQTKRGWGHSCYVDTVNTAIDAGIRELYLYHHDPNYDDHQMEEIHAHCREIVRERQSSMICHVAREGTIVQLK